MRTTTLTIENAGGSRWRPSERYAHYERMRRLDPSHGIVTTPTGVAILGLKAAQKALTRAEVFRSDVLEIPVGINPNRSDSADRRRLLGEKSLTLLGRSVLNLSEPKDHRPRKQIIAQSLPPELIHPMTAIVEDTVRTLVDSWGHKSRVDAVRDFARPLSRAVMGTLFGMSPSEMKRVDGLFDDITEVSRTTSLRHRMMHMSQAKRAEDALRHFVIDSLLPRDTPESALLHGALRVIAEKDGVDAAVSDFAQIMLAGVRTLPGLLAHGVRMMLAEPSVAGRLRTNAIETAAFREEVLRLGSPTQVSYRWVAESTELFGHTFDPGTKVAVVNGAANRDSAAFKHPNDAMFERFDSLGRPVSPLATAAPLPFGRGPHFCPGMLLTDVVADTAWRALVDVIDFPDHGRIREKLEPGHVTNQHASLSMPFDHCL